MNVTRKTLCVFVFTVLFTPAVSWAEEPLKPFVLASEQSKSLDGAVSETRNQLSSAGFDIKGEYKPYSSAAVLVVTNQEILDNAAASEFGGYGAAIRVAVTKVDHKVQVSFTNPVYMAYAYRMKNAPVATLAKLKKALGYVQDFGAKDGLTPKQLGKYHYTFGMEYFDEPSELGSFSSHKEAVARVETGLREKKGGASRVYRINIQGKEEVVFGVALTNECSSDEFIMGHIDQGNPRSTAHLPYEILISGKDVFALFARFRIAVNFPDLKMMGEGSFMKIMCAPGEIEDALEEVVS